MNSYKTKQMNHEQFCSPRASRYGENDLDFQSFDKIMTYHWWNPHQNTDTSSNWPHRPYSQVSVLSFPDSEHDVWPGDGAPAPKWRAGQEDCSARGKTGLHPPWCPVAACCAFSSNNQTTKGFPGRFGLPGSLPVILPERRVLFSPCQADLSRVRHPRDTTQLLSLTQCAASFCSFWMAFFHHTHFFLQGGSATNLYSYTHSPVIQSSCFLLSSWS